MEMVEPLEELVEMVQNLPVALVEVAGNREVEVGTREEVEEDDDSSKSDHNLDQTTK